MENILEFMAVVFFPMSPFFFVAIFINVFHANNHIVRIPDSGINYFMNAEIIGNSSVFYHLGKFLLKKKFLTKLKSPCKM